MNFRTDMAEERREYIKQKDPDGITYEEKEENGIKVTVLKVLNENGEKLISKPVGTYITVEGSSYIKNPDCSDSLIEVLADKIISLIPEEGTVLVAGIGNESITPDALGPRCVKKIFTTRHLGSEVPALLGFEKFRSTAGISPGVLGKTGIETAEIISSVVKEIKPCAVIAVDALAARRLERLGGSIQLTDSGIAPGSGIGNRRSALSKDTLGVPVIGIGVPTVVDGASMALDLLEEYGIESDKLEKNERFKKEHSMVVTPKEIDVVVERAAELVALSINRALQREIPVEDMIKIVAMG